MSEQTLRTALLGVSACIVIAFWAIIPDTPVWVMIAQGCGLGAVGVVLVYLVPGSADDLIWGALAGGVIIVEDAVSTYWLTIPDVVSLAFGLVAVAAASATRSTWGAGLRAAWSAWMVSCWGAAIVFLTGYRTPWMASVLDLAGTVDRYRDSSSISFWPWAVNDLWNGFLLRIVLFGALGAVAAVGARRVLRFLARR